MTPAWKAYREAYHVSTKEVAEIAKQMGHTGGPIIASASVNPPAAGPGGSMFVITFLTPVDEKRSRTAEESPTRPG